MRLLKRMSVIRPVRVAAVPEIARIASEWLETSEHPQLGSVGYGRRELAGPEKAEIQRRALATIPLRVGLAALVLALIARSFPPSVVDLSPIEAAWLGVLASVLVGLVISTIQAAPISSRMLRDASAGSVTIIRLPLANLDALREGAPIETSDEVRIDAERISILEVLEHSRIVWTVDGKHASWRLS